MSTAFFFYWLTLGVLSTMALFARLANCNVENVSADAVIEGDMQTISLSFPLPLRESLRILVSFEFLKGMCVLDFSIKAYFS